MAVTLYSSTDTGAPVLTSAAGSTVGVLDACLINGYGSKAAAGWEIIYTATNKRTYQAKTGNQFFLNIDDSQGTNFYARGFQTMTAWNKGTDAFPATSQISGSGVLNQLTGVSNTEWWLIATPTFFYFIWDINQTSWDTNSWMLCFFFGDFPSYKARDSYATAISASTSMYTGPNYIMCYLARQFDGTTISSTASLLPICGYIGDNASPGSAIGQPSAPFPYPEPVTGSMLVSPFYLMECSPSPIGLRGWLPGLYGPAHNAPLNNGDTFTGVTGSNLAGKTLLVFNNGSQTGQFFIEISDTWLSTMWQ